MTLQYTLLNYIQHLESVEVRFTHSDLSHAFAQMIAPLPKDESGQYLDGSELEEAIKQRAPLREWFEQQDSKLSGTLDAVAALPEALRAVSPIQPLDAPLEWFQDSRVSDPALIDGQWVRPVELIDLRSEENLPQLKLLLLNRLAEVRYEHETGGVSVGGALVKTDRESQATITGAYARALSDPSVTVAWKAGNGFVTLDSAAILLFGTAVFHHVQGCFAREKAFAEQVELCADVAALMALSDTIQSNWPGGD